MGRGVAGTNFPQVRTDTRREHDGGCGYGRSCRTTARRHASLELAPTDRGDGDLPGEVTRLAYVERKRRITLPDGTPGDAAEVGYRASGEHWNEYLLDDGSVIRLKPVVTSVLRIDGLFDQNGDPAYIVNSTNIVSVSAPEELRNGS